MRRVIKYFFVGLLVGIPLFASAFFAAGFGHGTYFLFALFLGAAYFIPGALFAFPALYGVYGVIALRAQSAHRRLRIVLAVILVHWTGAAAAIWYVAREEEGLTYLRKVWPYYDVIICGGLLIFLAAHWLFLRATRRVAPEEISLGRKA